MSGDEICQCSASPVSEFFQLKQQMNRSSGLAALEENKRRDDGGRPGLGKLVGLYIEMGCTV